MHYEVWDVDINRLFGTFKTEDDAMAFVRTLVRRYGRDYVKDLAMGCERNDGSLADPLYGEDLLRRVDEITADNGRAEARPAASIASRGTRAKSPRK